MIETWKYHRESPTPSLDDCLRWTRLTIQIAYKTRAEAWQGSTVRDAWNSVCDWLGSDDKNSASRLASLLDAAWIGAPVPADALAIATAFWVEAAHAHDSSDPERAWAALMQASYYLGMASGPDTAFERASRGGTSRGENYEPVRKLIVRWLNRKCMFLATPVFS